METCCENPNCKYLKCKRMIRYGDMILCRNCYMSLPYKKHLLAMETGKNQGIEELKA